ncbi:MAG: methyltransferase [Anaerolineaceae bacterium]
MEFFPCLQIGLWNAWILMVIFPLQPLIMSGIEKAAGTGPILKRMGEHPSNPRERYLNLVYTVTEGLLILYSIFLPLRIGTFWFFTGMGLYLIGLILLLWVGFSVAKTPEGQPFTTGVYRISRHPGYLSQGIIFLGVSVASASWVFLIFTVILWVISAFFASGEEKACLEKYGEVYSQFLKRTPRWPGIPKGARIFQKAD